MNYRKKLNMVKKEDVYRNYPLKKSLLINGRLINEIIISSHYEEKHSYLDDEIILELVKQLDNKRFDIEEEKDNWEYFSYSPLFYQNKTYKIVGCFENNSSFLGIRTCYRYKKYEKKK